MRNPTEAVAARIDSNMKTKLTLAAEECDITVSAYLETVVEEHINRNPRNLQALEPSVTHELGESSPPTCEGPLDEFIEEMFRGLE